MPCRESSGIRGHLAFVGGPGVGAGDFLLFGHLFYRAGVEAGGAGLACQLNITIWPTG